MSNAEFAYREEQDPELVSGSDFPMLNVEPSIQLDTSGQLHLTTTICESLHFDRERLYTFITEFGDQNVQHEVGITIHCPLSDIIDYERDGEYVGGDIDAYPLYLKPKYDAIRAELMRLVESIDEMNYSQEASDINRGIDSDETPVKDPDET